MKVSLALAFLFGGNTYDWKDYLIHLLSGHLLLHLQNVE